MARIQTDQVERVYKQYTREGWHIGRGEITASLEMASTLDPTEVARIYDAHTVEEACAILGLDRRERLYHVLRYLRVTLKRPDLKRAKTPPPSRSRSTALGGWLQAAAWAGSLGD